jgi:membrane protein implicated in regulation of membrane protease activity
MTAGRVRLSSLGAGAVLLAFVLLLGRRPGGFVAFLLVGIALLWYSRRRREQDAGPDED